MGLPTRRELALDDVTAVYRHEPLDASLVGRLNPEVDLEALADDIAEIGYPEQRE